MNFDISLRNSLGECVTVERFIDGTAYGNFGTDDAEITVTGNYRRLFNFLWLHGRKAASTIETLREVVKRYGTQRSADYWDPTPGNVGSCCARLLSWAERHPEAIWSVE